MAFGGQSCLQRSRCNRIAQSPKWKRGHRSWTTPLYRQMCSTNRPMGNGDFIDSPSIWPTMRQNVAILLSPFYWAEEKKKCFMNTWIYGCRSVILSLRYIFLWFISLVWETPHMRIIPFGLSTKAFKIKADHKIAKMAFQLCCVCAHSNASRSTVTPA